MEIKNIARNNTREIKRDKKVSLKKDFSQSFNHAKDRRTDEEFKKMIKNIKIKGERLSISKSYADVMAYKKMIKEYLKEVLDNMYKIEKDISFWQTQYFVTVETIDEKLEELTQVLINNEKESLNIAATIDDIQGMIVDIYR